ncbi:MAG: glycosyltransferase [Proteobacteria bacterium]|nr:MAG: glycosyltransferase [Pseudomonadota bacterium]
MPNGVDFPRIAAIPRDGGPHFAFVGRVTPIKDVKTCITAMAMVRDALPESQFSIVGPMHHDADYAREMIELARAHELGDHIFLGERDPIAIYESLTALVLTSISEALPFVALEAMSLGVPIISSDVGDCARLAHGAPDDDLGAAGIITPVGSPEATARAMLDLALNPDARERMGRTARERIGTNYRREDCSNSYRQIYGEFAARDSRSDSRFAPDYSLLESHSPSSNH